MDIEKIIAESIGKEICIHGYSDLTGLLAEKYADYPYAITIAMRLDKTILDMLPGKGPTREYLNLYNSVNAKLTEIVNAIADALKDEGAGAVAIRTTLADSELDDDYFKTLTIDFSHKMAATNAGLGWIGKTDLLVTEEFGPRVRLATVLTDYKLPVSKNPVTESRCGSCSTCVKACPAGAANGELWNVNVHRDSFYDAFKCREMCQALSMKNLNENTSICGICVSVCPVGRKK